MNILYIINKTKTIYIWISVLYMITYNIAAMMDLILTGEGEMRGGRVNFETGKGLERTEKDVGGFFYRHSVERGIDFQQEAVEFSAGTSEKDMFFLHFFSE